MIDYLIDFSRLVASSIGKAGGVIWHVSGTGDMFSDDEADAEVDEQAPYGALGVVSRPLSPDESEHADVICLRTGDGLVPVAARDVRLDRAFPAGQKEGATALAGYGGAFLAFDTVDPNAPSNARENIGTLYVPYARDGSGTPTTAHVLAMDPDQESISIVHGDGMAITMFPDSSGSKKLVLKNAAGDACIILDEDGITIAGNTKIAGAMDQGGAASLPLAKSAELLTWAALVNGALNSLGNPVAPLSPSVATTLTKGL